MCWYFRNVRGTSVLPFSDGSMQATRLDDEHETLHRAAGLQSSRQNGLQPGGPFTDHAAHIGAVVICAATIYKRRRRRSALVLLRTLISSWPLATETSARAGRMRGITRQRTAFPYAVDSTTVRRSVLKIRKRSAEPYTLLKAERGISSQQVISHTEAKYERYGSA
eukprot:6198904-Pleurochrysis_carterae.AAC.3